VHAAAQEMHGGDEKLAEGGEIPGEVIATESSIDSPSNDLAAAAVMAAERSAARIERMGYDVGYRLCERLAQHRPLLGPGSPSPESGIADTVGGTPSNAGGVNGNNPIIMGGGGHHTIMDPKSE